MSIPINLDEGTLRVIRHNVREVLLEVDVESIHFSILLQNEQARQVAEQMINCIGMKVVIPVNERSHNER